MVTEIRIYFEGHKRLRSGFHAFLGCLIRKARSRNIHFRLIPGEGQAIRRFLASVRSNVGALSILLVDSEGPVGGDVRGAPSLQPHLPYLTGADKDQLHLMVQCMEAWFLADKPALEGYYGAEFRTNRLPPNPAVEAVPRDDVLDGMKAATGGTQKGEYHKTRHAPDLLDRIDPAGVREAAPACERLFATLERVIGGTSVGVG